MFGIDGTFSCRNEFIPRRAVHAQGAAVFLLLLVAAAMLRILWNRPGDEVPEVLHEVAYSVRRVVDGDTLLLENGARIRLMGADTPETVKPNHPVEPFGPEATRFTEKFLSAGRVFLTFDRERLDRYGRFLAYAWQDENMALMLNEELIRAGLARAKTGYRFSQSMKNRFRRAEDEAKKARRGIWSGEETNPFE